jgi:GT2 family glycosyltransferase
MQEESLTKLAIVLLCYNNKDLLQRFVPHILQTLTDYSKLYIVDNASSDGTSEFVKSEYPQANLIRIDINKGFTNGYVESLAQIKAKYYCLISSDVEVSEGWIQPIIDMLDRDEEIGIVQPKIRWQTNPTYFEYSGAGGAFIDKFGYPFCRGRIFDTLEEDKGQYDNEIEVFWCSGACMFIRADVYHAVGGFDNDYYAHMEDIDLSWRTKNFGYKVMYQPKAVVFHVGGAVITYGSPQKMYRNFKNSLLMLTKNLPKGEVFPKIVFRLLMDGVAGIRAVMKGNFKELSAILKAHGHYYQELPKWLEKRKQVHSQIKRYDKSGIYDKSIVWDYFIKKKKKYTEL